MKTKLLYKLHSLIFILGGALVGLAYYYLINCAAGSCPITANPVVTMLYTALIGWLFGQVLRKEPVCKCNM